jgi:hypothetical protein
MICCPILESIAETRQNLSLGLFRSDYMVHQGTAEVPPAIRQVEFNTIASSFGGLSSQTSKLHTCVAFLETQPIM